jgi:hypothetical protein
MPTTFSDILDTFGLTDRAPFFVHALRITNAYIGGGTILAWHVGDDILPSQDLDIFFTPSESAPKAISLALFNTLFTSAGYMRRSDSMGCGSYRLAKALHVDVVANWYHRTLGRKIQVVVRSADASEDLPAYTEADFDICQFYAKYTPATGRVQLFYDPAKSAITAEIAEEICTKRVMRIGNLKGQDLTNSLGRLRKYYDRGFAFEGMRTTACSCTCGHEHTIKKEVRLTLEEASTIVRAEHTRVNNVRYFTAYVEDAVLMPPLDRTNAMPTRPMIQRPPPLEIPPLLEITDALETPPPVKRVARLIRKDDAWIRSATE